MNIAYAGKQPVGKSFVFKDFFLNIFIEYFFHVTVRDKFVFFTPSKIFWKNKFLFDPRKVVEKVINEKICENLLRARRFLRKGRRFSLDLFEIKIHGNQR